MAFVQEFVGGMYQAIGPIFAADTCVNMFQETRQVPGSAKQVMLVGTPGLLKQTTLATNGSRGAFTMDGRSFRVVGPMLYERLSTANYAEIGIVADDGMPVSFATNGRGGDQLAVVSAGHLYVLDLGTAAFAEVVLPFSNPVMITFIDGYGLINEAESPIVWFSNLEDFTIWDALDFFARSNTPDNIVAIAVTRDRVWAIGSQTTTLYYDSGDSDTPFVPYPGTTVQVGIVGANCLTVYADSLFWIAQSARGQRYVVRASDAQPQPISTPPIDLFLSRCTELDSATTLVYSQEGHTFVILTCPGSPDDIKTYGFDANEQVWHARAGWNSTLGVYTRWRAVNCTAVDGQLIVGDYADGRIYELSLDAYDDDGAVLMAERTMPYVSTENQVAFLDQLQLGMQPGVGLSTGQGSDPKATLEISRDGSHTWVNAGDRTLGKIGEYMARCVWHRLGRFFLYLMVIRVRQSDPVKRVWTGVWVRFSSGTGNY